MAPIRVISKKADLFVVRPMIEIERYEIESYLREKGIAYRRTCRTTTRRSRGTRSATS